MALVARGVGYAYGAATPYEVRAVRDVDLDVAPGDLVVIAGTTGSGKSTLLRLLAGLLPPADGRVEVDGIPPSSADARGRVSLVFQNPESQFFAETLLADVAFGPRNVGAEDPDDQARHALAAVGLDPAVFAERSPFTLSGGEARRAAIAGALAMRARYLLLDEPTAGLDARGRASVRSAIESERVRAGIVVVTHDPDEFLSSATHVLALAAGATAFSDSVAALTANPVTYERAGLRLPDVVRAQVIARARGASVPAVFFEPSEAAAALIAARRAER